MQRGVNKVILVGNLGKEPEIKVTADGKNVARFSIATSESWKDKATGDKKESVEWHRVVCFDPLATIIRNYLRKGSKVYMEGSLQTRKWADKDGNEKHTTEIVGKELQMLDSKSESSTTEAPTARLANSMDLSADDLPF